MPVVGMGTWNIAPPDDYAPSSIDDRKVALALRSGIEQGLAHIDTSENYAEGRAERIVGEAIRGIDRGSIFLATKMDPPHFSYKGVQKAASASLARLGTDYIDLYMLHWPPDDDESLKETLRAMEDLADSGTLRFLGVSNFSVDLFRKAQGFLRKHRVEFNQVHYSLLHRNIEKDFLPFAEENGVTVVAYSPFATGDIFSRGSRSGVVAGLAKKYGKTPAQLYLNWLISKGPVITIPKAVNEKHLAENAAAGKWRMEPEDYRALGESSF